MQKWHYTTFCIFALHLMWLILWCIAIWLYSCILFVFLLLLVIFFYCSIGSLPEIKMDWLIDWLIDSNSHVTVHVAVITSGSLWMPSNCIAAYFFFIIISIDWLIEWHVCHLSVVISCDEQFSSFFSFYASSQILCVGCPSCFLLVV